MKLKIINSGAYPRSVITESDLPYNPSMASVECNIPSISAEDFCRSFNMLLQKQSHGWQTLVDAIQPEIRSLRMTAWHVPCFQSRETVRQEAFDQIKKAGEIYYKLLGYYSEDGKCLWCSTDKPFSPKNYITIHFSGRAISYEKLDRVRDWAAKAVKEMKLPSEKYTGLVVDVVLGLLNIAAVADPCRDGAYLLIKDLDTVTYDFKAVFDFTAFDRKRLKPMQKLRAEGPFGTQGEYMDDLPALKARALQFIQGLRTELKGTLPPAVAGELGYVYSALEKDDMVWLLRQWEHLMHMDREYFTANDRAMLDTLLTRIKRLTGQRKPGQS